MCGFRLCDRLNAGDCFYLDFGQVFDQSADFDENHRGKMFAHDLAIDLADILELRGVLFFVRDVDAHTGYARLVAPGLAHNRENIFKRKRELVCEVVADDSAQAVPSYLPGYE